MNWLAAATLLALVGVSRPTLPPFHEEMPSEPAPSLPQEAGVCPLGRMARALERGDEWQDLSPLVRVNPALRRSLDEIMPDFQLAFLHASSHGVLLIQSTPLDEPPRDGEEAERFWREVAAQTRSSCTSSGVECAVERLTDAPLGLSASTFISRGRETYRRETLAFIGADRCSYAIQFSGPQTILSPRAWEDLRRHLDALRKLVAASHD